MSDPRKLRACASALRTLPTEARAGHLADWCEQEAKRLQDERAGLEWRTALRDTED